MPNFDAAAVADSNGTGPTTSVGPVSLTVANQSNRVVYAALCTDNASPTSITATFGGNAMTLVGSIETSGQNIYVYRLINPATGASNCSMSWTGNAGYAFFVASYYDVHQTTPERGSLGTSANAGSANPSVDVSSAVGDLVVSILNLNNDDGITEGAGQTRDAEVLQGGNGITGAVLNHKDGASGTVTSSWTTASQRWGAIAMSLQAPGGSADPGVIFGSCSVLGNPFYQLS